MAIGDRDVSYEAQDARPFIQGLVTRVSMLVAVLLAIAAMVSAYAALKLFSSNYVGYAITESGAPFKIPVFRSWQEAQQQAIKNSSIFALATERATARASAQEQLAVSVAAPALAPKAATAVRVAAAAKPVGKSLK